MVRGKEGVSIRRWTSFLILVCENPCYMKNLKMTFVGGKSQKKESFKITSYYPIPSLLTIISNEK